MEFTWETASGAFQFAGILFLSHQNRSAVHVEDFPGDEARLRGAQKEDGTSDLFRPGNSAQWDGIEDGIASPDILQGGSRHVRFHPPGRNAIDVDTIFRELSRKSFNHTDECAFGGRV